VPAVGGDREAIIECEIPAVRLVSGDYSLIIEAGTITNRAIAVEDSVNDATQIRVSLGAYLNYPGLGRNQGHIAQRSTWEIHPSMELHR